MTINWPLLRQQPQTYFLLCGTVLGYSLLLAVAGNRPVVWLGGSIVATAMASSWVMGYQTFPEEIDGSDLLNLASFHQKIDAIQAQIPATGEETWQTVKERLLQSHTFAVGIRDRTPSLHPELIEALYTALDLAQQVADDLQVQAQIQTAVYQTLVKKQLKQSCDRVEHTHLQLQQLQDLVALTSLSQGDKSLPKLLEDLIVANKETLHNQG